MFEIVFFLQTIYFSGNSKAEARDKAAKETLEMFEENCYSILVKNKYLSDGTTINANELEAVPEEKKVISGSNIGKKHALKKYDQFTLNTSCFCTIHM